MHLAFQLSICVAGDMASTKSYVKTVEFDEALPWDEHARHIECLSTTMAKTMVKDVRSRSEAWAEAGTKTA